MSRPEYKCSFCGIEESRSEKLFLGPNVAICNICVNNCSASDPPNLPDLDSDIVSSAIFEQLGWGPLNRNAAIRSKFCCEYCGKSLTSSLDNYYSWELDHIIPNGDNDQDNLALSCRTCNHLKHFFIPKGKDRAERIECAKQEIAKRRERKSLELDTLRDILMLPKIIR